MTGQPTGLPTVVVVDDSQDVRTLVRAQIRMSKQLEVVGEGVNGHDAVALAERLRPDLMLLDVSMPVVDGLTALPRVLAASPGTRVVMYSGFDEHGLAARAADLGAAAFVSKSAPFTEVLDQLLATDPGTTSLVASSDERQRFEEVLAEHLDWSASVRCSRTPPSGWRR